MASGVSSALAGTDVDMPGFVAYGMGDGTANPVLAKDSYWGANLLTAVKNGSVPVSRLDDMVTRTMASYYKMGQDRHYSAVNFSMHDSYSRFYD